MKRGEIYFIKHRKTLGHEVQGARPAIIVSHDALNATSEVVEVVYLTTKPKKDLPTHATIHATGVQSTALCEHIDHVSTLLVGHQCGVCSAEEMEGVNAALMASLGLIQAQGTTEEQEKPAALTQEALDVYGAYVRACAERDTYKGMLDRILRGWGCEA